MLRLLLTAICTLIALQPLLRVSAAAAELPAADEVAAVELLRLSEPGSGIFAVYPEQGFSGVVVGESALYRFTPGGEYELPQRLERPTSLVQRSTGRLLVADAAQPGVFHIMRTPDTAGSRGRSITNGTGDRPLHRPASLLQELQYRTAGANGAELVVATGSLYLSDRGEDADPASGVVFYLAPSRASPTGFETRVAADGLGAPEGLALSKDGTVLYVVEQETNRILGFPVTQPGRLGQPQVIAEFPVRDPVEPAAVGRLAGLCLDDAGRLYVADNGSGVIQVLDTTGRLLRRYDAGMPSPAAVAFSERDGHRLYVAGRSGAGRESAGIVTILELGVPGLRMLPDSF